MVSFAQQQVADQQLLTIRSSWFSCSSTSDLYTTSSRYQRKRIDHYLGTSTFLNKGWRVFFWGLVLSSVEAPATAAWDMCRKASKRRLKIISMMTNSSGLQVPRYRGSSIWDITWSAEWSCWLCLIAVVGRLHPRALAGGTIEAVWSAMEELACSDVWDLNGLGAIGSVEDAFSSSASSPYGAFLLSA